MRQSNARRVAAFALGLAAAGSPSAHGSEPRSPRPWRSCTGHFSPRTEPRIDVLRLGLACGPVTGLTRYARANGIVDESAPSVVLRFKAERKDCFRLFAVAGAPVDDLEVEITGPRGARVSLTNQSRRWVVVGEEGPFCAPEEGDFEARLSTHAGRGAVSAAVWRGARMLVPGTPWAEGTRSGDPY